MSNSTLGYAFILAGLAFAAFGGLVGVVTGLRRQDAGLLWVRRAAYAFAACMAASNGVMVYALLSHDFSVKYVAQVGSRATPTLFTIVSLWSALEGSILFWGLILGLYLFAFTFVHRKAQARYLQLSLGVMLLVAVFFTFLIAGPANPWSQIPNPLPDGPGPNPLLQNHWLMVLHPPMLYFGYVGMTVPFGLAAGALLRGELTETWIVPLRRWTLIPWLFLTIGIVFGSWWAYAVLGWGGYWAWDPVENASFLPWLTATAYMHSTMVLERRRMLKVWTLSLAFASFLLTILGTFMTRSGVFNSVHSFTQSDIGPTFLVFLGVLFVFSVVLLSLRGHLLVAEGQIRSVASRETSMLVNNLVFVAVTFTVLLGTVFPLLVEGFTGKKITVGEPYFDKMAVPGGLLMLFLMGVGPMLPWGEANPKTVQRQLLVPSVVGALTVAVCAATGLRGVLPLLTFFLAGFVVAITLRELFLPAKVRITEKKESPWTAVVRSASRTRRRTGGYIVHLGVVAIIVAIAASRSYSVHTTGTLSVGETMDVGKYKVRFTGLSSGREPHRTYTAAGVEIISPDGQTSTQSPRMNFYERSTDPVGTPGIQERLFGDVYVSLLAFDTAKNTASFNAWVFPLVGWIWYSLIIIFLGTLLAVWPQRRAATVREPATAPAESSPPVSPDLGGAT